MVKQRRFGSFAPSRMGGGGRHIPESPDYHIGERDGRMFVYGTDCDDNRADVHPKQIEVCNGRDDNCNGVIDEGLLSCRIE